MTGEGSERKVHTLKKILNRSEGERIAAITPITLAKLIKQQKALSNQKVALYELDF
jgi:hypothetical protein